MWLVVSVGLSVGLAADPPAKAPTEKEALAAFADIYAVSQHPRCLNCHPGDNVPLQTDDSVPHNMGVTRLSPSVGLMCSTCHRAQGLEGLEGLPPADPHWQMPPASQGFKGRTAAQLCAQLKDPVKTGGRDLQALVEHVKNDHLLLSSWHSGRTPPPLTHPELVERYRVWAAAGGPCPD